MEEKQKKNQINIELKEDVAQGVYSNLAIITHSTSEFVLDFVRVMPGIPKAEVKSRIILTPEHAKRLLLALKDNIAKKIGFSGIIAFHLNTSLYWIKTNANLAEQILCEKAQKLLSEIPIVNT